VLLIAGRTDDHLVEITLTTIIAYGSFLIAEHFHMSGILASLTSGIVVGNGGWKKAISLSGRDHVLSFWEYAAFLANSMIFIVIGLHEAHQAQGLFTLAAAVAIVLAVLGRALAVYPFCALFAASSLKVRAHDQLILVWGGLRGGLALALALSVPDNIPERGDIIVVAFAVVAFSIFAQGLTMPLLMRRLGAAD
jgi:Na+:H+ antiporter